MFLYRSQKDNKQFAIPKMARTKQTARAGLNSRHLSTRALSHREYKQRVKHYVQRAIEELRQKTMQQLVAEQVREYLREEDHYDEADRESRVELEQAAVNDEGSSNEWFDGVTEALADDLVQQLTTVNQEIDWYGISVNE